MVGEGRPSTSLLPTQEEDVDGRPSPTMTMKHVRETIRLFLGNAGSAGVNKRKAGGMEQPPASRTHHRPVRRAGIDNEAAPQKPLRKFRERVCRIIESSRCKSTSL
jgi:hypothetical protein